MTKICQILVHSFVCLLVLESKPIRSPLTQGGLEIKSRVRALWFDERCLWTLYTSIQRKYDIANNETDDSKSILNSLGLHEVNSDQDIETSDGPNFEFLSSENEEDLSYFVDFYAFQIISVFILSLISL